jgi:hypothetical protein
LFLLFEKLGKPDDLKKFWSQIPQINVLGPQRYTQFLFIFQFFSQFIPFILRNRNLPSMKTGVSRDGLGPKSLHGNRFIIKATETYVSFPQYCGISKKPQFHLKSNSWKASLSLKMSFKSLVIFKKASNF